MSEQRSPRFASPRPAVLAVDDTEANLVALQALLDDMDCEIVFARSGNDALRLLLRREFAVMLLDVQMPGMDGYELAQHARRNPTAREVPIIFLTAANDSEGMVLRGYGSGAVDFLFKPLNAAILRSKVRVFLDLYRATRTLADANAALELRNAELSRAYAELQTTQAQLVQSAKMASLGELVAGVAHEVNNPLAFVLSHVSTVRRDLARLETEVPALGSGAAHERWQRLTDRLREVGPGLERIRELMVKLRTFSRLDEGERKRVDVKESIDSVLTILSHRLPSRVELTVSYAPPLELDCYPGLLNQALMNLVSNALDALEATAGPGKLEISAGASDHEYLIVVTDTGPGIPPALRPRVLDPFFTTKPVGQGTGLGLSITDSIVRKHGGRLELSDRPGGGARMIIHLPLD